jgi:integrase
MVELKGLHIVKTGGRQYVYAWRGGPAIKAPLGSPAFMEAYNAAIETRRIPDNSRFSAIIYLYRSSPDFDKLAPTTKRIWSRWLDRIRDHFGPLSIAQFNRPEKIRPTIREWRSRFAHQPRTADYALQVLSRVLSFGVESGKIASNPCEGIKGLYANDRSDIIWTDEDIEALRTEASTEVMWAVELAAATGLRAADLFRLSRSHVGKDAIVIATSKSRFKKEAVIPLYDELRELLDRIPKRSPVILTNSRWAPWGKGFNSSYRPAVMRAGLAAKKLHFHDLRGTAATRFYLAGFSKRVIAEIMGWEEATVEKIIRRYVNRHAAVREAIDLMRVRAGTAAVKVGVKPSNGPGA